MEKDRLKTAVDIVSELYNELDQSWVKCASCKHAHPANQGDYELAGKLGRTLTTLQRVYERLYPESRAEDHPEG